MTNGASAFAGKQMGPTDELKLQVEAGHVYKLQATPGGKMCTVRADDITATKKNEIGNRAIIYFVRPVNLHN